MDICSCQFNDTFLPVIDGTSITVKNYAYWLNKKYGKAIVATPYIPESSDDDLPYQVVRYKSIDQINKAIGPEINIIHAHSPFESGYAALKIAKQRKIPLVASIHTNIYDELKEKYKIDFFINRNMKKVIKFLELADYAYVVNQSIYDMLKVYGYKNHAEILEDGTEYEWEEDLSVYRDYINHRYEVTDDTNVLLYVGNLTWQKNMRILMEAFANMRKLRQRFKVFLVGDGNAKDEMVKFIEQNRLSNYIAFVGEIYDRDLLKKFYARANLFVYPTASDTSATVIREAASFRCPSLVLKDSDVSNIIKDNFNGYLSDSNSLSYAQRIIAALNDMNKVKVGITAQNTLARRYEEIVDIVNERYNKLLIRDKQFVR